ncbi:MAG: AsnC family transcriptional regulator [Candidatus Aenigmarchaeota archaeon]|nr:AsnC family transcriptional regulator [Candidatus Aenigmarchaeota archaeon]
MTRKTDFQYRLLYELSVNSRISQKALAKRLRISPQLVSYRLDKFEKDKIIQTYKTQIDSAKFGLINLWVFMVFTTSDKQKQQEVVDYLDKSENVTFIESISYGADLMIEYTVPNLSFFNKHHSKFLEVFSQSVKVIEIFPIIVKHHLSKRYLNKNVEPEHDEIVSGDKIPVTLSDNAKRVLAELFLNPSKPIIKIAQKTKLDPRTVIKIKKELEKEEIIRKYTITINYDKLDIRGCILLINFDYITPRQIKKIILFLRQIPEITTVIKVLGKYKLIVKIETLSDYMPIICELREKYQFHDFIIYRIGNIVKNTDIPISVLVDKV